MPLRPAPMLPAAVFRPWAALWVLGVAMFLPLAAKAGPGIGQFEIKTLGAEPGETEWQSQNDFSRVNPRRRQATGDGGELLADDNSITRQRNALEGEWGLTNFLKFRIGIGFERERFDDPQTIEDANRFNELKFDEVGFETNWTLLPRNGDGFGFGVVLEFEVPVSAGEAKSLNVAPLFELASGPWVASFMPILTQYFGGGSADEPGPGDKLDFGYAARLMYRHSEEWALAIEAYGSVERIGRTGRMDEAAHAFGDANQHRAGPIVYWTIETGAADDERVSKTANDHSKIETTLGLGAFFGLNDTTPDTTLKFSVEVAY